MKWKQQQKNKKTKLLVNSDYDADHVRHVCIFGVYPQFSPWRASADSKIRDPTNAMDGMRYVWRAFATAINWFGYKYCMRHAIGVSECHLNELSETMNLNGSEREHRTINSRKICNNTWNSNPNSGEAKQNEIATVTFTVFCFAIIHWCDNCYLSYFFLLY